MVPLPASQPPSLLQVIPFFVDVDFLTNGCDSSLPTSSYVRSPLKDGGQEVQPKGTQAMRTIKAISHIIIATPTAPPTTSTISLHHPLVIGASAVWIPGFPEDDPVVATPAVPVGVSAATPPAPTTVTAVTTDWLPLGSVLVCTTVLVKEDSVLLPEVVELPGEGEMVCTPPPIVETMVRPTLLVLVMSSPCVREAEVVLVVEGDSPAEVGVDVDVVEPEPAAIAPLDDVLVDVVVEGALELAPADVVLVSELGLEVALEDVSPP